MNRLVVFALACGCAMATTGCGSSDASGSNDETGEDDGGQANEKETCEYVPRNESGDGKSICFDGIVCEAGEYCDEESAPAVCRPGCLSAANCAWGYACDLDTPDLGTCADPADLCTQDEPDDPPAAQDSCVERCLGKAATCEGGGSIATTLCKGFCADGGDIDCLEAKSCGEIGDAYEQGTKICS
jgi:hypothetical protein